MSNEKKPFTWDKKKVLALLLLVLILGLVVVSRGSRVEAIEAIPSATEDNPKFVLAEWDYPDEYGQGIYGFKFYENSTGAWLDAPYYAWVGDFYGEYYFLHSYDDYDLLNWSEGVAMKIRVYSTFNNTVIGAINEADGQNYQRHSVNVSSSGLGITKVFSQQNFTYFDVSAGWPFVQYQYEVILEFLPLAMTIYTITIDYELYYEDIEEEYEHDCSSVTGITYQDNSNLGASDYGIGSDGSSVEFWILPDDALSEGVIYKLDFTNILNPDNDIKITMRYKIEGATNYFYYYIVYDDASSNYSSPGLSTTWANLVLTPELGKTLDYILLYNYDTPNGIASGNLSAWIDYIKIERFLGEEWNIVGTAALLLEVSFDEWGYNVALVILGLCMIPGSTLYLAYGVKHDRTSDRMFYGLIIFLMGFGLLVAGITP